MFFAIFAVKVFFSFVVGNYVRGIDADVRKSKMCGGGEKIKEKKQ